MKKFDFYEFTAILLPGAILIFGISRIYPAMSDILAKKDFTLGEFGLFVILAYAAGHIIQTLGNVIETAWWWCVGGMPTDWLRSGKRELIAPQQAQRIRTQIQHVLKIECPEKLSDLSSKAWYSITRQIYSADRCVGLAERIDIFNGNYGMFRGISASLVALLIAEVAEGWPPNWRLVGIIAAAGLCSLLRMHRFGVIYAREIFVQFIGIQSSDSAQLPKKKESE